MFDLTSILTMFDSFQIRLFTWRKGTLVGTDQSGNRYYRSRRIRAGRKERRWCVYQGRYDASKVTPEWFGWLHHLDGAPLSTESQFHKPWIKPHKPNQTGTAAAYRPAGHPLRGGVRRPVSGDYQPWLPS